MHSAQTISNLSESLQHALVRLEENLASNLFDLIESDKKGGIVAVNTKWTVGEMRKHMSQANVYECVARGQDVAGQSSATMVRVLSQWAQLLDTYGKKHFTKPLLEAMRARNKLGMNLYKMPYFRLLIKDHKDAPYPGRPIVSCMHWISHDASVLLTDFVQSVQAVLRRYADEHKIRYTVTRNSAEIVLALSKETLKIPPGKKLLLVTADFDNLYTNESFTDVIGALLHLERLLAEKLQPMPNWVIPFAKFVLNNNYFTCLGDLFHQISGFAMGTSFAPDMSNTVLLLLEFTKQIKGSGPRLWRYFFRFIDDILAVLIGDDQENAAAITELRASYPQNLQLNIKVSESQVDFLDLNVYRGPAFEQTGLLDTRLYEKTLAAYEYIRPDSEHNPSVFKGIYCAENKRHLVACSQRSDYEQADRMLRARLIAGGWSYAALHTLKCLPFTDRPRVVLKVASASGKKNKLMPIVFKTTYNRNDVTLIPAGKILRTNWELLPQGFREVYPTPVISNRLRPALLRSVLKQSLREVRYTKVCVSSP